MEKNKILHQITRMSWYAIKQNYQPNIFYTQP